MADVRREKFNKQGQIARDLADLALREIDEALEAWPPVDNRIPITDDDTLASPIGYYSPPESILD